MQAAAARSHRWLEVAGGQTRKRERGRKVVKRLLRVAGRLKVRVESCGLGGFHWMEGHLCRSEQRVSLSLPPQPHAALGFTNNWGSRSTAAYLCFARKQRNVSH